MNRLRQGFALSIILGSIFAAAGLFTSLTDMAAGVVVACCGLIGLGAVDYVEARRDHRIYEQRVAVWARRDS